MGQHLAGQRAYGQGSAAAAERGGPSPGKQTLLELAPRFGHAFDDVAVHEGAAGDAKAKAHGAPAVAEGRAIYLSRAIDPRSAEGRRVIAHEMAHVVQQTAPGERTEGDYEAEAQAVGDQVAAGAHAAPQLRTGGARPQGYGGYEHKGMGDSVHEELEPIVDDSSREIGDTCGGVVLGGVSGKELGEQQRNERAAKGASHAPDDDGSGIVSTANANGRVAVPHLAEMLARDPFHQRGRALSIPLRNFHVDVDDDGPFLGMEIDPATQQAARYDVPVSFGDLTALNGDLYGSMENMRKAPVSEVQGLQRVLADEAAWEADIIADRADAKDEPDFDEGYEKATAWRAQGVYAAGNKIGAKGEAAGGDTADYIGLALHNHAHFGEDEQSKSVVEVHVQTAGLPELADQPQGNAADGNEEAWFSGHARALLLAQESFQLALTNNAPITVEAADALDNHYGRETDVPATGLVDPAQGGRAPYAPNLERSATENTADTKANDAYVENAGADHFLTDAFSAGHQIVRQVIGDVTLQFVEDQGGREKFLDFVAEQIQIGALADRMTGGKRPEGQLGQFQDLSFGWTSGIARGDSWVNWLSDGLEQTLDKRLDETAMRGIGAKVVHDYYNRHGLIVHNKKGMTFMTKGDGHANEAPEAQKIIAAALLESRDQVTQTIATGVAPDPQAVWDYAPDFDKTAFTETSGRTVLISMFSDPQYLWNLIKGHFSAGTKDDRAEEDARLESEQSFGEARVEGDGKTPVGRILQDMGHTPMRQWFDRRVAYVQDAAKKR